MHCHVATTAVSIRSPYRSKGRLRLCRDAINYMQVSIRSPYRSKGRQENSGELEKLGYVSIRSPYRSKGRHWVHLHRTLLSQVSIRSPYRSKGRLPGFPDFPMVAMFQSAPLTEARGDFDIRGIPLRCALFQSAPLTEARGDWRLPFRNRHQCSFNPLPLPKQGETYLVAWITVVKYVSIRSPYRSKGRRRSK